MQSPEVAGLGGETRRIGEILVDQGKVTEEQVKEALKIQRTDSRSLGNIMVSKGFITNEDLAMALAIRLDVAFVDLAEASVDPEMLGLFEEEVLQQHNALPLRIEQGRLLVAMSSPNDLFARSDLTISAGHPITPVIASYDSIQLLHDRVFGGAVTTETEAVAVSEPEPLSAKAVPRASNGAASRRPLRPNRGPGQKIGQVLLMAGEITREQLDEALATQENDPQRRLGEIMVSLEFVTVPTMAAALGRRLRVDHIVLSEMKEGEFDSSTLELFDEETLRKHSALPLRIEEGRLILAMIDPNDRFALEDLRIIAKMPITPVVAVEDDLEGALLHLFGDEEASTNGAATATEAPLEQAPPEEHASGGSDDSNNRNYEEAPPREPGSGLEEIPKSRKIGVGGGKIGDILVDQGKISEVQLEEAILTQQTDARKLGEILISLGFINKDDLARALAIRLRLEYIDLTESDVDRAVANMIEQKVLRKHSVIPLRMEDGRLLVAMSDPTNIYALEDLMMISGSPVTPVVALESQIQQVQNKIYAVGEEVTEFLEEAGKESIGDSFDEIDLGDVSPDEAPIIRLVSSILQQAVGEGASDIHIEPRARELTVRMRVDGVLREVMSIPPKLQNGVIARLKIVANLDIAEKRIPQDGRFSVKLGGQKIDLRVAALPTVFGEKIVLRLLDTSNAEIALTALGFPVKVYEKYEEIFRRPYGAILVTGPTGSGKSTTLYATLNELNSPEKNIITVEDPVEFRMRGVNQMQTNPKAGLTFASALKSILRADPDIVMIGEIRDFETAKIAVEAALTGHLVLATLHTNDAPGALSRLTDMGVEPFLTSSAVDCVIAQRLARRLCEACKEPTEIEDSVLDDVSFPRDLVEGSVMNFHKAVGCNRCGGSGYRGRVGVYELMVVGDEIKDMILRRESTNVIGHSAEQAGMVRLRDDGLLKVAEGLTTIEEVFRTIV
jgi:type IV pilus assembly protein PilB